jgi:molybdenum cofactor synthesis domain-containing protein
VAMISYRQALDTIVRATSRLPGEVVPLTAAPQRVLAASLIAPHDLPPFAQSMMDGYALRSADTHEATPARPVRLRLGATLTAGETLSRPLPARQALRIMTGAALPGGVDAVVKLEDGERQADTLIVRGPVCRGAHVQQRGAEIRRRTVVLRAGEGLTPQGIGAALALGIDTAEVVRQPCVALIAPGDELLPPGAPPQPGKKWCSNLYALDVRLQELGCRSVNLGIVPDTLEALLAGLERGRQADVVVILGASGRGDHDFAARAIEELGAEWLFRGVATSPGRSIAVARWQQSLVFGLPGSPWAAFVGFEALVRPALRTMLGQRPAVPPTQKASLTVDVRLRRGVTHLLPVSLRPGANGWHATPLTTQLELARVETRHLGLLMAPSHRRLLQQGTTVQVQLCLS